MEIGDKVEDSPKGDVIRGGVGDLDGEIYSEGRTDYHMCFYRNDKLRRAVSLNDDALRDIHVGKDGTIYRMRDRGISEPIGTTDKV